MLDYLELEVVLLLLLGRFRDVVVAVVAAVSSAADTSRSERPDRSPPPLPGDAEPDVVAVPVLNRRGADVIAAAVVVVAAGNHTKNTVYIHIISFSTRPSYRAVQGGHNSQSAILLTVRAVGLSEDLSSFVLSRYGVRILFSMFAVAGGSIQSLE